MSENLYGYVDDTVSQQGDFGEFGLNQNAFVKSIAFNPNAGKDGTPSNAVEATITLSGGRDYLLRIFEVTGEIRSGKTIIRPKEPGYEKAFQQEMQSRMAAITHLIKSMGVTEEEIKASINQVQPKDFPHWCAAVISAAKAWHYKNRIDVFLEYQWSIKDNSTQTFLQIPVNLRHGAFLCPATNKTWQKVVDSNGLHYIDTATGEIHPFTRNSWFMNSNKANQQKVERSTLDVNLLGGDANVSLETEQDAPSTFDNGTIY